MCVWGGSGEVAGRRKKGKRDQGGETADRKAGHICYTCCIWCVLREQVGQLVLNNSWSVVGCRGGVSPKFPIGAESKHVRVPESRFAMSSMVKHGQACTRA
eukprot:219427-Chlamydomonas_euryale.AAC.2